MTNLSVSKGNLWNRLQPPKTCLLCHIAYGQQTLQGGDLPQGAPTNKVTWPFDHVAFEFLWQIKTIISLLLQCLRPTNLAGWWLTIRASYPSSHMTLWERVFTRSRDKLKPSHLHYHKAYDHQTWQDGYLPWRSPTHKVTWPFGPVALEDHVKN